jgi:ribosome-associated protein
MIIASGTSSRHVSSLASRVVDALKSIGLNPIPIEGQDTCDWVLVDAGDIIVHLFRPEARSYYNLEKMWSVPATQLEAVQ